MGEKQKAESRKLKWELRLGKSRKQKAEMGRDLARSVRFLGTGYSGWYNPKGYLMVAGPIRIGRHGVWREPPVGTGASGQYHHIYKAERGGDGLVPVREAPWEQGPGTKPSPPRCGY